MAKNEETLTRVADDIYQIRLPLPFALRIVNVYLLRGAKGWTIVDTGIHTPQAEGVWRDSLHQLGIHPTDIEKIIMTHTHPDHFGMSGWLRSLGEAHGHEIPIYTSSQENAMIDVIWHNEDWHFFYDWLLGNGMPDAFAQQVAQSMGDTRSMTLPHPPRVDSIAPDTLITMGERTWRAILTPGHSDGHFMFYDESDQLLLSGDHVLMKITPNIGLWSHTQADPLGRFMASLDGLKSLGVRLALPGHKWHITDWAGRIEELLHHHDERLQHVEEAVDGGARTPYDVTQAIFITERFTPHEWRFALAESLAHLEYLQVRDKIARVGDERVYTPA